MGHTKPSVPLRTICMIWFQRFKNRLASSTALEMISRGFLKIRSPVYADIIYAGSNHRSWCKITKRSASTFIILNGIKLRIQELPPMSIMVKEQVYALKVCLCPGLSWGSGSDLVISVIKGKEN